MLPFQRQRRGAGAMAAGGALRGLLRRRLSVYHASGLISRPLSAQPEKEGAPHSYETLKVEQVRDNVLHVELNRPEKRNAMNIAFWREMVECFNKIAQDSECHAVVISGAGKMFTSGIDLMELGSTFIRMEGDDTARKAWNIRKKIRDFQETFNVLEKCPKPVIAAIHGACIGGGMNLITACDIRYCTQDTWFQVKEVDIGLAADVGVLQRLPHVIGNRSLVNELAFTARKLMAPEAESSGLVSRVFQDKETMMQSAFDLAVEIASKSPVAVQGTKVNLVYSRDHSVPDALKYMASWNMSMLQTDDILKSAQAVMEKKTPKEVVYSKL
ncbi:delta(3,5)-Delta(2,4)-dienoyl-CoA isomerase, mitochondrial [Eublepharis macularius]|uniref:Delta(3,5)-Delta(2,4)-dienoyl-CoA isomerase, mitochondrial n=1 Tax=Eublepharis macularius TaxID=481883 RepID=A0AA97KHH7_EUBMA|nr:delta(3,5)-Delta(2,4)-dienoyl-CoA isomerase, mitochondrial [Eublepharis macularius]